MAEDLRTKLLADASIAAVVDVRVYQNVAPETAELPYIIYARSGREVDTSLSGSTGLANTQFSLECRADGADEAEDLADLVHACLHAQSGTWGSSTVRGAFVADVDDQYVPFPPSSDKGEHSVAYQVNVHHVFS